MSAPCFEGCISRAPPSAAVHLCWRPTRTVLRASSHTPVGGVAGEGVSRPICGNSVLSRVQFGVVPASLSRGASTPPPKGRLCVGVAVGKAAISICTWVSVTMARQRCLPQPISTEAPSLCPCSQFNSFNKTMFVLPKHMYLCIYQLYVQ